MDKERVVEKLRAVIKEFATEKGEFSLVMLIPTEPDVIDSKVTLLISAPWLDEKSPKQAIELIVESLRRHLKDTEFQYITRVTIVKSSDGFVKAINVAFNVKESLIDIENCNIFGIKIDRAFLLESHQVTDSKERVSIHPSVTE